MKKLLAQVNIARLKSPIDHPDSADFKNNLDHINSIAETSPGFVWRLKDEANNATSFNPYDDELVIINASVWEDLEALKSFVYNTEHIKFFQRRKEWFVPISKPHMAMWSTNEDNFPDAAMCKNRLDHLWKNGPSVYSFDYKSAIEFI